MAYLKESEEMEQCECGIITYNIISWDYPDHKASIPLCNTCQKELLRDLIKKFPEEVKK